MQTQTPQWRRSLGLTAGNPFASFIIGLTVITVIGLLVTLGIAFFGKTAETRFWGGVVFMFVGGLAPIPVVLLMIYSRNYVRIQDLVGGNYWVHWDYPREVYIGAEGVYFPAKRLTLNTFWSGLISVEILRGDPSILSFEYLMRRYYSAALPPIESTKTLTVPIPQGKEDEAEAIVQRLRPQIGKVSNFVNDQWKLAWILGGVIIGFVLLSILLLLPLQFQLDDEKATYRNATATAQQALDVAQLNTLIKPIRAVMDNQIEHLESLPDGTMSAEEAGFDSSAGVRTVFYGHCPPDNAFYLYVILNEETLGRTYFREPGSFNYTTANDPRYMDCGPEHWISTLPDKLEGGWYYSVMAYIASTRTPRIINTVTPTASPS